MIVISVFFLVQPFDVSLCYELFCRLQREEAKIAAWENLQKAKAEAAIRKLEVFLFTYISSSQTNQIINSYTEISFCLIHRWSWRRRNQHQWIRSWTSFKQLNWKRKRWGEVQYPLNKNSNNNNKRIIKSPNTQWRSLILSEDILSWPLSWVALLLVLIAENLPLLSESLFLVKDKIEQKKENKMYTAIFSCKAFSVPNFTSQHQHKSCFTCSQAKT